jgi:hypothetical protein
VQLIAGNDFRIAYRTVMNVARDGRRVPRQQGQQ